MAQPPAIDIGERIRQAREASGLSQPELARRLNLSHATISRYETGDHQVTVDMLLRIAHGLALHPAELLLQPGERIVSPHFPEPRTPGAERMLRDFLRRQGYTADEIDTTIEWLDYQRWRQAQRGA